MLMSALSTRWGKHDVYDAPGEQHSAFGASIQDGDSVSTEDDRHTKDVSTDDDRHTKDETQEYVYDSMAVGADTECLEHERSLVTDKLRTTGRMMLLSTTPTPPKSTVYASRGPALATSPARASLFPSEWHRWQRGLYDSIPYGPSGMAQHGNGNKYFQQQRPAHMPPPSSLSGILAELSGVDSRCLVVVRKLHRLGRFAQKKLRAYFSRYGVVVDVLISYSSIYAGGNVAVTRRSGSIGFVLMKDPEKVARVIAQEEHEFCGTQILVEAFVRRNRGPM